jgi:hypothetical protein
MAKNEKRNEAPTVAPKFDVAAYARESERRLEQAGDVGRSGRVAKGAPREIVSGTAAKMSRAPSEARVSMAIPKASPTGIDGAFGIDLEHEPILLPTTVPVLFAHERVTELLTLPTESFLLGFIDGARDIEAITRQSGLPIDLVMVTVSDLARSGVVRLRQRSR